MARLSTDAADGIPAQVQAVFAEALQQHRAGRLTEAEQAYRRVVTLDAGHADSLHLLGVIAHHQGRVDAAAALYRHAIAERPDFAEARNNLGSVLHSQGLLAQAVGQFQAALQASPGDPVCFIGLIRLALPNARIIHVQRDPLDTCLSCFATLFGAAQPYSYDLGELGRYYRAHAAVMAHWRSVLPADAMLDVQYEAVVTDLAGQARRMLAYCGLDWDAACLEFDKTQRPVRTASAVQVRQPLYRGPIGRWLPYRDLLGPLLSALDLAAACRPLTGCGNAAAP